MKLNTGDVVYACLGGKPTQCRIMGVSFGGEDIHLVTTLPDKQSYLVSEDLISDDPDTCFNNYRERFEKEYKTYQDMVNSPVSLILHLLHAAVNGRRIYGTEKKAIIDQASQFTQIDVSEYLDKLDEIEKENKKNNEADCL